MRNVAAVAAVALIGIASSASALIISGGPSYTLPGGGSCSVVGVASQAGGATISCTGLSLSSHTRVYFGIKNNTNVNGQTMTGSTPTTASPAVFRYSSSTGSSITYTSTTSVTSAIAGVGTQPVSSRLVLTAITGSLSVISTGGNPANNNNADIQFLFEVTGGTSFTVRADVQASDPLLALGYACPAVYDPSHSTFGAGGDISKADVAFYFSDCGDGIVDSPEVCDIMGANGSPTSCCTATCQYRAMGAACRVGPGAPCDATEVCTGSAGTCPADDAPFQNGVVCRPGSGDICDQNELCTGAPGQGCPPDDAPDNTTIICRASTTGDICDEDEYCSGAPGATCPADDAPGKINTVCRPGSNDICDPDERCTGFPGQACPPDVVSNPTTVCRVGSGDFCDPSENCTAIPGQPCPSNVVTPSGTQCRAAAGSCDVAEQCTGTAGQTCPSNGFVAAMTPCNQDGDVCTTDQCNGSGSCTFVSNVDCDDDNVCTQDACDPDDGCEYTGEPSTNCATASKALFKYKDPTINSKDNLKFLWRGGPAPVTAMGDPTQSTLYELCVYDNTGVQLAMGVPSGPGSGWKTLGSPGSPKGYKYLDRAALNDGIKLIKLKASNLTNARVKVSGKGDALPDTGTLPFQFPVTAQLYASDGMCFEAQFGSGQSQRNEVGNFLGRTP